MVFDAATNPQKKNTEIRTGKDDLLDAFSFILCKIYFCAVSNIETLF